MTKKMLRLWVERLEYETCCSPPVVLRELRRYHAVIIESESPKNKTKQTIVVKFMLFGGIFGQWWSSHWGVQETWNHALNHSNSSSFFFLRKYMHARIQGPGVGKIHTILQYITL